jgi:hypothetical protein
VARLLELPLAGEVPTELLDPDGGTPPGSAARGPLARFCSAFWSRALTGTEAA